MRILIVDDDKVSADFLLKALSRFGICDITINGIEAVDAFLLSLEEGSPYDLICLDLMLPLLDGENVLAAIRKIELDKKIDPQKKVKVIITSALNDTELTRKLSHYGFDAYMTKPIEAERLIELVKRIK